MHAFVRRPTRTVTVVCCLAAPLAGQLPRPAATPQPLGLGAPAPAVRSEADLVRFLDDARFAIDNGASERAIRPLAIGRANWLQIGGDGGLKTGSVLLSVCAGATRHRLNPWSYLRDVLDVSLKRSISLYSAECVEG